jgi:hypothetical protein
MKTGSRTLASAGSLMLAAVFVATPAAFAQSKTRTAPAGAANAASAPSGTNARKVSPYRVAAKPPPKAQKYYIAAWGVDNMKVNYTSSGNLIRFSYRVTNPERAKALSDKTTPPYLVGQKNSVALQVPVMEKIGPLRQTAAPKEGQEYWMVFSNKGNLVRPGDRVNVMIGAFHVEGLVVE